MTTLAKPARIDLIGRFATWTAALSPGRRLAVAGLAGAIGALALPPLGLIPALLLAFPPLLLLLGQARTRWGAFGVGWAFGLGHHLFGLYWVSAALFVDIGRFWWALPLSVAGLPLLMSVYAGLATLLTRLIAARGVARPLAFAAAWGVAEWLRGHAFTGFPWNLAAYAWSDVPAVLQLVSIVGSYGLTTLTVLVASLPAALFDEDIPRRRAVASVAAGLALLGAGAVWGTLRLAGAEDAAVPGVRLRLVQPAIEQHLKWIADQRDQHLLRQMELSAAPPAEGQPWPTHVIWAETAVPFFLDRDPRRRALIGSITPPGGVTLTGVPRVDIKPDGERVYANGLIAIDTKGTVVAGYDKAHLVPFGEYVPFRRFIPFGTLDAGGAEYTPGPGPATLDLPGLPPVSPLICYEVIFPRAVTDGSGRARWLLNITNDAWYGGSAGPYQHFAIAQARAVEEGVPLVRVANTGISGVVDAYGRVRARLGLDERGVLDADLPVAIAGGTTFGSWGDGFFALLVLIAAGIGLRSRRHERN